MPTFRVRIMFRFCCAFCRRVDHFFIYHPVLRDCLRIWNGFPMGERERSGPRSVDQAVNRLLGGGELATCVFATTSTISRGCFSTHIICSTWRSDGLMDGQTQALFTTCEGPLRGGVPLDCGSQPQGLPAVDSRCRRYFGQETFGDTQILRG